MGIGAALGVGRGGMKLNQRNKNDHGKGTDHGLDLLNLSGQDTTEG